MICILQKQINHALTIINMTIERCEKAHLKFEANTSQYTLLKNRLNAFSYSKIINYW